MSLNLGSPMAGPRGTWGTEFLRARQLAHCSTTSPYSNLTVRLVPSVCTGIAIKSANW